MAYAHPAPHVPAPRVDLTPLVGVLLVLMTFALTALPIQERATLVGPAFGEEYPFQSGTAEPVLVEIRSDHTITWNGQTVDNHQLGRRLAATSRAQPQPEFQIIAANNTNWSEASRVINEADDLGIRNINLLSSASSEHWARQDLEAHPGAQPKKTGKDRSPAPIKHR